MFERTDSPNAQPPPIPATLTGQAQSSFVSPTFAPPTPTRIFTPAVTQPPHLIGGPSLGPPAPAPGPPFLPPPENLINYPTAAPPIVPGAHPPPPQFPPYQPFAPPPVVNMLFNFFF